MEESKEDRCKCGMPATPEKHACPFDADVNDDDTPNCTCCLDCQHECADDI